MAANYFYEHKESWKQVAKRWEECGVGTSRDEEIKKEDLGNCLLWLDIGPVITKKPCGSELKQPVQQSMRAVGVKRIKKEPKKRSELCPRPQNLNRPAQLSRIEKLPQNHHHNTIKMEMEEYTPYTLHDMDTSMPVLSPITGAHEPFPDGAVPQFEPIITGNWLETYQNWASGSFSVQNAPYFDPIISGTQSGAYQHWAPGHFPTQNASHFSPIFTPAQPPVYHDHFPIFEESMVPCVEEEVTIATDNSDDKVVQSNSIPQFLKDLGIDLGVYFHEPTSLEPTPQIKKKPGNAYNLYRAQWRKRGAMIPFRNMPDEQKRELENAKVTIDEIQKYQMARGLIRIEDRRSRMNIKVEVDSD